jgi:ribosomal protein S18 acetylase RimI-like enzyme
LVVFEELGPGREREALLFLEREPVKNLRIVWSLRNWGLFNLGLPEQGVYLAGYERESLRGILFRNNLGLWRLAADMETAGLLGREALSLWGTPQVLAGPEKDVEALLEVLQALRDSLEHREEELSLLLCGADFKPYRGQAVPAREEDLDDLVRLEMMLQEELLGGCSASWALRLQMLRAVEKGGAALVREGGRAVAKAEIEAVTPKVDELGGVYTIPSFRRRGYANSACTMACGKSLDDGKKVRLETQRDNEAAISFYMRLGFRELWPHLAIRFRS